MAATIDTASFRELLDRLLAAGRAANIDAALLETFGEMARELADYLDRQAHRPSTLRKIERLRALEEALAERDAGERASRIRERLGLGKSHYYALRKRALASPLPGPDSGVIESTSPTTRGTNGHDDTGS